MRIAIDVSHIQQRGAGISRYSLQMVSELVQAQSGHDFVLYGWSRKIADEELRRIVRPNVRIQTRRIPGPIKRAYWNVLQWPSLETMTGEFDVFQSADMFLPPLKKGKGIVVVHDLWFLRAPWTLPSYVVRDSRRFMKCLERASAVVVPSQTIAAELRHVLSLNKPLYVRPPSVSPLYTPKCGEDDQALLKELRIKEPYVLFVGTIEPRKNLHLLARAFLRASACIDEKCTLVIAGKRGWKSDKLMEFMQTTEVRRSVQLLGYVSDRHLAALYRHARMFAYVSQYEGYGIPVAEALTCGTPVMTSSGTACAEVAGDAALLVDPADEEAVYRALMKVLNDPSLRRDMKHRSLLRGNEIRSETTGRDLLEFYESLGVR
jgi:glycosyltransferase involved in cell wall biosynthesis